MNTTERTKRNYIRQILYEYRIRHGVPAELYLVSVGEPNYETGEKNVSLERIDIPQLITISVDLIRKFEYDISFIKANSNFAYGAFFEIGDRFAIVDGIYLNSKEITQKDYIVYDNKRYDPKKIHKLDGEAGYLLQLRSVSGQQFNQIHKVHCLSSLTIEEDIDGEL